MQMPGLGGDDKVLLKEAWESLCDKLSKGEAVVAA